ncbi:hypothetical protein [Sulfitobacter sp.]|jgi:flagellar biosynthesis protein FliR|uniref:hypothetical protein n=1 Tax=Sulfitobacter sp. TaxID=1903071 RepID=UPI0039E2F782
MINRPGSPLFLARRSYRFRRLMDAVRLLPVMALAFWLVPLLWPVPDTVADPKIMTSHALRYVFGVWLGMILLALFLWRRTARKIAQEYQS